MSLNADPEEPRARWSAEHHAMACDFGLELWGQDPEYLRSVAQEAFDVLDLLEAQLSVYIPSSDVSWINATAAEAPVRVEPYLFDLLQTCERLHRETEGAFDITAGPLIRCWGFYERQGQVPDDAALANALGSVGMEKVVLNPEERSVAFLLPGVEINLGAIGKGYALRRMMELIGRYDVSAALAHSGGSTLAARGAPPGGEAWRVGVTHPGAEGRRLGAVRLRDGALASSGSTDQFFTHEGKVYGHILDPRTGYPAQGVWCDWVAAPDPAEADAWSTALFVLGPQWAARNLARWPEVTAFFVLPEGVGPEVVDCGLSRWM